MMFFVVVILSLLFAYIKQNKWFLFKKIIFLWFRLICMQVYHDFFWVPRSRSTFPDTDPDPDPGQWYGSDRIRIRNTAQNIRHKHQTSHLTVSHPSITLNKINTMPYILVSALALHHSLGEIFMLFLCLKTQLKQIFFKLCKLWQFDISRTFFRIITAFLLEQNIFINSEIH